MKFERLTRNLEANGAWNVIALMLAAGRSVGRARLLRPTEHPSQTRLLEDDSCGESGVVRLEDLLGDYPPPRLVKVDVEGSE